MKFVY